MIIQCDQCKTKFRLDDAKVPDKGVKVRCAKCKNIFLVQKEVVSEEPDLDILLSNLGAQSSSAVGVKEEEKVTAIPERGETAGEEKGPETVDVGSDEAPSQAEEQHAGRDDFAADFFSTGEEPAVEKEEEQEQEQYQFGEVTAGFEETIAPAEEPPAEKDDLDFGELPFEVEEKPAADQLKPPQEVVAKPSDEFDFGSIDFGPEESATQLETETPAAEAAAAEPGEFAFGELAAPQTGAFEEPKDVPHPDVPEKNEFDFGVSPVPPPDEEKDVTTSASEPDTNVPWDSTEPGSGTAVEAQSVSGITFDPFTEGKDTPVIAASTPEPVVAKEPVIPTAVPRADEEEELPPLAITSRKRESSILPIIVTSIAVLVVLAVGGVGFYVFKEGPAAFDKLGLSFLAKWLGMHSADQGSIVVKNPQGAFMVNREAGEIFVVSGEVVNNYKEPRASIQVKATVLGPKGEALMQKTAYCGNLLAKDQLTTLPMEKIEESMNSPFGDALANLGVPQGKSITFVVVFTKVPKDAGEFTVEVVGSSPAN
jgi:predicted Zn finger-like uncharacterized protein